MPLNGKERRNNHQQRRNHNNERRNDKDTLRDNLRHIAIETLEICDDGEYFPPGQDGPYDIRVKIMWTDQNTRYYGPDTGEGGEILKSEFIKINKEGGDTGAGEEANEVQATVSLDSPKKATPDNTGTTIYVGEYSTIVGARKVYLALARRYTDPSVNNKIGVLNFASAKKPGGDFINGSRGQEESLSRASTLYPSLVSVAASEFYVLYHEDPGNAYRTHAMVYSPGIILIRDDNGEWRSPVVVDVLTSAAVNAGEVRRGSEGGGEEFLGSVEVQIEQTMYARISRILHLFQLHQIPHLILGSFGTGDFKNQNRTDLIANIFADLLIKPGARFKDVFKTVVFAIVEKETMRVFSGIFLRADKRAQRERTGSTKTRVFVDSFGGEGDGDVKEGDEEKRKRMIRWKARRREFEERVIPDEAPITAPTVTTS